MAPFVRCGDVVTVEPAAKAAARVGDVVAFACEGAERIRVHRIIGRQGDLYLIKGDNTPSADGLVREAGILGRVCRVQRNGRAVLLGGGPESRAIAWLSRRGWLVPLLQPIRGLRRRFRRPGSSETRGED